MREIISRKDAIAKGMNRYFTGKECKNNHIDERSVIDWACVSCRNDIRKKIHLNNIKRDNEISKNFYHNNKERCKSNNKNWRKNNPEACKKHSRQSFLNNPARVDLHTKARRAHTKINLTKEEKKRILFFGDSNTAADGVSNEDRYSDLLGEYFDAEIFKD